MGVLTKFWYALLFALIIGLFFYDNVQLKDYLLSKEGVEREAQLFGRIINISEDHFYIYSGSSDIRIESANVHALKKAEYGETVVHVVFRKDGTIEGLDYHNYDYNYLLYFFSFIAFVIFLIIFFKEWRLTLRGFEDA